MTQFTTLKEYDNAVRASQRKLKGLNEKLEANPLDGVTQQALELAKAAHKFLLASRAKFKEQASNGARALEEAMGIKPGTVTAVSGSPTPLSKPTAAEVQPLLPRDRQREFVPQARIIRERSHAGAMREPKYAPDDCRNRGLAARPLQRRAEQVRKLLAIGITPKFPSERYPTQRIPHGAGIRRITVNGQVWA